MIAISNEKWSDSKFVLKGKTNLSKVTEVING